MQFWLLKSEPVTFSIEALQRAPQQITHWDGVRNYQARNYLRNMQVGDLALFYHSNCTPPGIVGVVRVVKAAHSDDTAWDPTSEHYDPRSTKEVPIWSQVDVQLVEIWKEGLSLETLKSHADTLGEFPLVRRGNRLSVMPVTPSQWEEIHAIAGVSVSKKAFSD